MQITLRDLGQRALGQRCPPELAASAASRVGEDVEADVDAGHAVERADAWPHRLEVVADRAAGVVSETFTSTTPLAWMSIERTIPA
jgi:hypothetical protein